MFYISKYIPKTSLTNTILESKMLYKSNILYNIRKINHFEYLFVTSNINISIREKENYNINENIMIKLNTTNHNTKINYSHKVYYNDLIFSKIKFGKQKPTLWTVYNDSIKKLCYEIMNKK